MAAKEVPGTLTKNIKNLVGSLKFRKYKKSKHCFFNERKTKIKIFCTFNKKRILLKMKFVYIVILNFFIPYGKLLSKSIHYIY